MRSLARLGSRTSVLDCMHIGSALSVRGKAQVTGKGYCSIMNFALFGSGLSIRSYTRLGSLCSVAGNFAASGNLSVTQFVNVSSALSIRGATRMGTLAINTTRLFLISHPQI